MTKTKYPFIKCPECGRDKDLSLHVSVSYASVRIPVVKGQPSPAYEILRDQPIASDKVFMRLSDAQGETRITLHQDDMTLLVHCPYCKKMLDLPKGMFPCSDAE